MPAGQGIGSQQAAGSNLRATTEGGLVLHPSGVRVTTSIGYHRYVHTYIHTYLHTYMVEARRDVTVLVGKKAGGGGVTFEYGAMSCHCRVMSCVSLRGLAVTLTA